VKEKVLVIGGSGFIGKAIQKYVIDIGAADSFIFTYNRHDEAIQSNLDSAKVNLLEIGDAGLLSKSKLAIYVAGNSYHSLAFQDPKRDLELNVFHLINFMEHFHGSLVMLSSQAIYYGLEGEIRETNDHIPTMPYGLSKRFAEGYANYYLDRKSLERLWIFRMMYAFGDGESERRLIPRCALACSSDKSVTVNGGGKSYLNPLPSNFVAEILVKAATSIQARKDGYFEITNINHREKATVVDIVTSLSKIRSFDYSLVESGEEWPVKFYGNVDRLENHLRDWGIGFPDLQKSMKDYFLRLVNDKVKQ